MSVILAVAVTLLALCVIILQARNNQLQHMVRAAKALHTSALAEGREWERKYWTVRTGLEEVSDTLDRAEEGEALAPPSHNVEAIDVEAVMAGSDDPVWEIVTHCRSVGVMGEWANTRPDLANSPDHRKYGEFATFILQLPEDQQSVQGVSLAVRRG